MAQIIGVHFIAVFSALSVGWGLFLLGAFQSGPAGLAVLLSCLAVANSVIAYYCWGGFIYLLPPAGTVSSQVFRYTVAILHVGAYLYPALFFLRRVIESAGSNGQ